MIQHVSPYRPRPQGRNRTIRGLRARQPPHLVSRFDQVPENGGTHHPGPTGDRHRNTHAVAAGLRTTSQKALRYPQKEAMVTITATHISH